LEYGCKRSFRDPHHGAARGLAVPEIVGAVLRCTPRQRERLQNQLHALGDRKEHRVARLLGVQKNSPGLLLLVAQSPQNTRSARSTPPSHATSHTAWFSALQYIAAAPESRSAHQPAGGSHDP